MALAAIQVTVELAEINCGTCGGVYAINERFRKECHDYGKSWTCPYCKGSWGYSNNNELSRLKAELESEKRRREVALSRANEAEQAKAKVERKLRRVARGVCTCCNRSFKNLREHMATKHPETLK